MGRGAGGGWGWYRYAERWDMSGGRVAGYTGRMLRYSFRQVAELLITAGKRKRETKQSSDKRVFRLSPRCYFPIVMSISYPREPHTAARNVKSRPRDEGHDQTDAIQLPCSLIVNPRPCPSPSSSLPLPLFPPTPPPVFPAPVCYLCPPSPVPRQA